MQSVLPQIIRHMCNELFHVVNDSGIPPDNVSCFIDRNGAAIWNIDVPSETMEITIQVIIKDKDKKEGKADE